MIHDARTKRFIAQRDRAEAKARAVELENERLRAQVERMRPVVEAANGWVYGDRLVRGAALSRAVHTYCDDTTPRSAPTSTDPSWILTLSDGRTVTIGASITSDPGAWLLSSEPLLRWLTAGDTRLITDRLSRAAEHLERNGKP